MEMRSGYVILQFFHYTSFYGYSTAGETVRMENTTIVPA
jgi:hypothetical protein